VARVCDQVPSARPIDPPTLIGSAGGNDFPIKILMEFKFFSVNFPIVGDIKRKIALTIANFE
jgi:hypothetical protein